MSDLKLTANPDDHLKNVIIIHPAGFLDGHTAPEFKRFVQALIQKGAVKIIVDCEPLDYISSAGLGVFMNVVQPAREAGGDIILCNQSESIRSIFETLGFNHLFKIFSKLEEARTFFASH